MGVRILVAPAGSRFSASSGSEDGWLYDIVTGVASGEPDFRFTCVAGSSDGPAPERVRVVTLGGSPADELGSFALPFRVAMAARAIDVSGQFDLVHHGLPFAAGRSFTIVGLRAARRGIPLIIGPVQTPLEWTGPDELGGQLAAVGASRWRAAFVGPARAAWPLLAPGFRRLSDRTLRRATRVVAITPAARDLVIAAGVGPERVEVIPPPVRMPLGGQPPWPRPDMALRLLTAGYLIQRKGILDIAQAVAGLAHAGEPLTLDVAGDGPSMGRLRHEVSELPGGTAIRLHGWLGRQRLAELYASSHVYISMSRAESWGHSLADALRAGLVVVAAANVGARAMADIGAPLRILPTHGREQLTDELRQLCRTDLGELQREGEAGARWAAAALGVPVIARRWARIYREALALRRLERTPD